MNERIPWHAYYYTIINEDNMHNSRQAQIWQEVNPKVFRPSFTIERPRLDTYDSVLEKAIESNQVIRPGLYLVIFPDVGAKVLEVEEIPTPRLRIKQ